MENKGGSIIFGVKWTTISAVISALCKFGQIVVLSRFLTKEEFGLIGVALMCINVSGIFVDLGITSGVMHIQQITRKQYSSLFWLNVFSGGFVFLLFWMATPLISIYYKEPQLNDVLPIIFSVIFITSFYRLQRTIQFKQMNFRFIAITEISSSALMMILSVAFALLGMKVYSLVYSTIAYYLWLAVIYLYYALRFEKNISFHFRIVETKPFLKIGMFQLGGSVIDTLASEMDTIIIGRLFSMEVLGVYTLCKQLAVRIYQFINPIFTNVLTPALAKIQDDIYAVKDLYLKAITTIAIIIIPIYFFLSLFSMEILGLLYGDQYKASYVIFIILCAINVLWATGNPVGSLQIALGRTDLGFYWTIYRVLSYTLALLAGAYTRDINLCVFSVFLINIINMYPSYMIIIKKMIPLKFSELLIIYKMPLSICFILSFVLFLHWTAMNDFLKVALALFLFFSLYAIIVLKKSADTRDMLIKVMGSFAGKQIITRFLR